MMPVQALATATSTVTGSTCSANVNGQVVTVEVVRGLTVAVNDVLLVNKVGAQWVAVGRLYATTPAPPPPDVPPPPSPKPGTVYGHTPISPVETRSWRPSWGWRFDNTDVYQGEFSGGGNHIGSVFYGVKPHSLAGVAVTGATMHVKRLSGGVYAAQSTTMRLLTEATRPAGAPTMGSSTAGPSLHVGGETAAFVVPTSWAQSLVDGSAGGIGFHDAAGSPFVRFAGRSAWSPAFVLTISWRRN